MPNIKLVFGYDGTDYAGFQRQQGQRTIQGVIEDKLTELTGEQILIYGSGRTDAGVHALAQVCNFHTNSLIPAVKYSKLLQRLPKDILVTSSRVVEDSFHAQKSAHWKRYRYLCDLNSVPDLMLRRFRTHWPYGIDLVEMQKAAAYLVGEHDFTSFCSSQTAVQDKVRQIYKIDVSLFENVLSIEVTGNGFLYNMVRIIVGTLCEVGRGRMQANKLLLILSALDRRLAGPTMPPEGLMLMQVGYSPI